MTARREEPESLRGGIAWSLMSFLGGKAVTLLATLILARLLTPSEFGVAAAVLAFIVLFELISDLGMKATVIYESESGITSRVHTAFTLNMLVTLALAGVAVALAPFVAAFFGAEDHETLFMISALDLLFRGLGNIHDALLQREMQFRRRTIAEVASAIARAAVMIALAVAGVGATALVVGFIVGGAVWTLTLWVIKPFRPRLTIDREALPSIAKYGGWATVLSVIAAVWGRLDVAIVGNVLGAGALGLYTIAQRLPELLVGNVSWSLSLAAFPTLSRRRDESGNRLADTTLNLVRYSALFALPVSAFLAVLAPALTVVLFSSRWEDAAPVMAVLAIMFGIACIVIPLGDAFKALGRQPIMVAVNCVTLPLAVAAMLAVASSGLVEVALARTAVAGAQAIVWIVLISRTLGLALGAVLARLRPGIAVAAGVAIAGLAVRLLLPEPSLGPLLVGSLASFTGGWLALKMLAPTEYREIRELARSHAVLSTFIPARWRSESRRQALGVEHVVDATADPLDR
jgi:PST family polysaccharide transporter